MTYPQEAGFKARETSREAAEGQAPTLSENKRRVLESIKLNPGTPEAVAGRLDLPLHTVRPRCTELAALGLIEDSGQRGQASGGRRAIVWRAKP